uniref:Uncharacterized protein n=1 Tax=Arundo donax TaxID=35708 RepID=A0A0A9GKW0_ARUDO
MVGLNTEPPTLSFRAASSDREDPKFSNMKCRCLEHINSEKNMFL